jgi:hypothetical protein
MGQGPLNRLKRITECVNSIPQDQSLQRKIVTFVTGFASCRNRIGCVGQPEGSKTPLLGCDSMKY